jgi:hypothetical protein
MSHKFHKLWLKITAIVVGSFGADLFPRHDELGEGTSPANARNIKLAFEWNHDLRFARHTVLSALTGGFLLGWGVMIWFLSSWVYDAAPEPVRRAVVTSLAAWFFLDSSGSITSGNTSNVFFNVLVLLVAVGPLWRPAKN